MYTQCPECEIAFHVTAEVLKQAAGKVRCGGCGVAFNSLAHLTEEMPARRRTADGAKSQSADDEPAELEAEVPPKAISAAESAALLRTLDQLAGEEIRIEDTGVEWRVIAEDEVGPSPDTDSAAASAIDDEGEADAVRVEMRFDDNTPLPDDFDLDALAGTPPDTVQPPTEPEPTDNDSHVDFAFGDAGDWGELLDDLEDATSSIVVEETNVHAVDIEDFDELPVPVADVDTQFAMLGPDLSGRHRQLEADAGKEVAIPAAVEDNERQTPDEPDAQPEPVADEVAADREEFREPSIDQEMLAIAVAEDDGFYPVDAHPPASDSEAIVTATPAEADSLSDARTEIEDQPEADTEANPLMESIVMEGECVRQEEDLTQLEFDRKAALESLQMMKTRSRMNRIRDWQPPRHSKIAAAAVLSLVLVVQLIHHSREALATSSVFQATLAPVYRALGSPVTPAWDIRGWRFEATSGNTDEAGEVLTIHSRIGNTSTEELPYPLLHVALTDRFEEIIGSRVLPPEEYLAADADPGARVAPRENFNALISIQSPTADATGFKLDVCYRLSRGQLRCAFETFK